MKNTEKYVIPFALYVVLIAAWYVVALVTQGEFLKFMTEPVVSIVIIGVNTCGCVWTFINFIEDILQQKKG